MARLLPEYKTYSNGTLPEYRWEFFQYSQIVFYLLKRFYTLICPQKLTFCISPFVACQSDMSSTAFIEALPVIDFVAQILDKDVFSRPLSDADRVKVLYYVIKKCFQGQSGCRLSYQKRSLYFCFLFWRRISFVLEWNLSVLHVWLMNFFVTASSCGRTLH